MNEIYAKPIINGKFWVIEQNGDMIGTLQKQDNDKFILSNTYGEIKFDKQEELESTFGSVFFLPENNLSINLHNDLECHGYPTKSKPFNSIYDVKRKLPMFTKDQKSKCYYCAEIGRAHV